MLDKLDEVVALTPRDKIYSTIAKNPGLHFREIQRRVVIATGALQYHIDYLKKKNLIHEEKLGKFSHYYASDQPEVNSAVMNLLRQDSVRKIVVLLAQKRRATLKTISVGVSLGASTTSFHLQKLLHAGIVVQKVTGAKVYFSLSDKQSIIETLFTYRKSFLDEVVDNFIDLWEKDLKAKMN